jgi:hypothetical protein
MGSFLEKNFPPDRPAPNSSARTMRRMLLATPRPRPPGRVAGAGRTGIPPPTTTYKLEDRKKAFARKTLTVARKLRNRSRNRINDCPEPAGKGHFCTRNGPKTPESARFLPETVQIPADFTPPRRATPPNTCKIRPRLYAVNEPRI